MKKSDKKKLSLTPATVRVLTAQELEGSAGGYSRTCDATLLSRGSACLQ